MYCPRCGHKNTDEKARHCSRCGAQLPDQTEPVDKAPLPERVNALGRRLVGSTRRERLMTGGIAAAVVVALVALFVLRSDDEGEGGADGATADGETAEDTRDPYIQEADRICLDAKKKTAVATRHSQNTKADGLSQLAVLAEELGPVNEEMRIKLSALDPPPEYQARAAELEARLLELRPAVRATERLARQDDPGAAQAFGQLTVIGGRIETAISELGLTECESLRITTPSSD